MTDELTRRGYDAELRRHRENLERALSEVRRVLDSLENDFSGGNEVTSQARRLLAAAGDAVQSAGALSAASQLDFTVEAS